jgi:apolipoprotein D and lipocalin family protein
MRRIAPTCALTVLLGFGHALAAAPQPSKPVAVGMYFGRWYQIAQIAKINRNRCPGATDDFSSSPGGGFVVLVTCHESSGDSHQIRAKVSIIQGSGAAKFKMSFFGGLISQEYWVIDHAPDQSWVLMATPGGNYLWLLARRPVLDGPVRAVAFARISALGYDTSRLIASR